MTAIIPSWILIRKARAAFAGVACSAVNHGGSRIQLANIRNNINRVADSVHLGHRCRSLNCRCVFGTRETWPPHQETFHRVSVRRSTSRTNSAFRTKVLGFSGIISIGIPTRNARLTPLRCVADVGLLVPTTRNRHRRIVGSSGIRHNGSAFSFAETRVLISRNRYYARCSGTRIRSLRPTSRIATQEERNNGEENQKLRHRSTNLSNTIVARRNQKCKSCHNKQVTICDSSVSYNPLHGEKPRDFGGKSTSRVCSLPTGVPFLSEKTPCQ
jgi:hypothetical protein